MNLHRRFVLKSMAVSGLTCLAVSPMRTFAAAAGSRSAPERLSLLVLISEEPSGKEFLRGVIAATGQRPDVMTIGRDLASLLDFERRLRSRPMRAIGLLDDAAATLAIDMARSAGARMRWCRQHVADRGTVERAAAWASGLGYRLASLDSRAAASFSAPWPDTRAAGSFVSLSIET